VIQGNVFAPQTTHTLPERMMDTRIERMGRIRTDFLPHMTWVFTEKIFAANTSVTLSIQMTTNIFSQRRRRPEPLASDDRTGWKLATPARSLGGNYTNGHEGFTFLFFIPHSVFVICYSYEIHSFSSFSE
jgi:hypothetical protein